MKQYLLFFRDDILRRIGMLPFRIVLHYIYLWCTSIFFVSKANYIYAIRKNRFIIRYLDEKYGSLVPQGNLNMLPTSSISSLPIWVFWYQGLSNAPDIVKICVASIKKNAGNHRVIILTDDNYKQYVDIPKWVEEKKNKGIITRTNYSDLLRLSLLAKHGGMWIDSTFFCTAPILDEYFKEPLWSIKRPDYFHASIASGYFAGYSLACNEENRFAFITIRDFFLNYWKHNDTMIDYLMVDYMIVLAQKYDKRIAKIFADIKPNNPACDELYKVMGEQFDESKWSDLKKDTYLFKLSWKYQYLKEKNNKPTFYGIFLDEKLK